MSSKSHKLPDVTRGSWSNWICRGLRFSKRFVYFQDEPVEAKHLSVFHQNEKPAVSNPIAAWASQTGKGLVFLTKRSEDKATPAGIINLVGFLTGYVSCR